MTDEEANLILAEHRNNIKKKLAQGPSDTWSVQSDMPNRVVVTAPEAVPTPPKPRPDLKLVVMIKEPQVCHLFFQFVGERLHQLSTSPEVQANKIAVINQP